MTSLPNARSKRPIASFLVFAAILMAGCKEQAAEESAPPPVANPTSLSLRDPNFLTAIGASDGANTLEYAAKIQANEKTEMETLFIPCEEFETTTECDQRQAKIRAPQESHGPGFTAFVIPADFEYDADAGTATIGGADGLSFKPYLTEIDGHLTITPVGAKPPENLRARVERDRAKRWRTEYQPLRLAVVISLEQLPRPVMGGDSVTQDQLDAAAGAVLSEMTGSGSDPSTFDALRGKRFDLKARVVRVVAFHPKDGGIERPIYDWISPERQFVR